MKKRFLSIIISATLLLSQNMPLANAAGQFNGYDVVDGIIMDEEAREKVKESDEKPDSQQSDAESLLLEEELKILEEEAGYSDRFIVKYKDAGKKNDAKLKKAAKKALDQAKALASEKEAQRRERLKNVDSEKLERLKAGSDNLDSGKNHVSGVAIHEISEEMANHEVIELDESIDPEWFVEEIARKMGSEIAYIQPDYAMELSGSVDETALESEDEKGLEGAADSAEDVLEMEEVTEGTENVTDSTEEEEHVNGKTETDLSGLAYNREQDL